MTGVEMPGLDPRYSQILNQGTKTFKVPPQVSSAWQSVKAPLSDTTIRGYNVGNGLNSFNGWIDKTIVKQSKNAADKVIFNQGQKAAAKAMGDTAIHLTKGDIVNIGSKTFTGRLASLGNASVEKLANAGKWLSTKIGITPKANYLVAAALEVPSWYKGVFKEDKGVVSQTVHSGAKITGGAVGFKVGMGVAASAGAVLSAKLAAAGIVLGPMGIAAGAVAGFAVGCIGGAIGYYGGDKIGGLASSLLRKAGNFIFGSDSKNKTENPYQEPPKIAGSEMPDEYQYYLKMLAQLDKDMQMNPRFLAGLVS